MELVNEHSLTVTLKNCSKFDEYYACILVNDYLDALELIEELRYIYAIQKIGGAQYYNANDYDYSFVFKNGSYISVLTTSDICRLKGTRFHKALLCEDVLDVDAIMALQNNTVRRRSSINNKSRFVERQTDADLTIDKQDEIMIDEFLNQFSDKSVCQNCCSAT